MTDKDSLKQLCANCTHQSCCTGFDSPLVFPEDLEKLEEIGKASDKFLEDATIEGKALKRIRKNQSRTCIFWNGKCKIYDSRPFDCKMFPFDIDVINGEFYWIIYSCNQNSDWAWTEEHLRRFECDPMLYKRRDRLEIFDKDLSLESKHIGFTVLRKVRFS